jgi:hypothetical protein
VSPSRESAPEAPRAVAAACAVALFAALSACGNLTSGGYGDLEVLVASDTVPTAERSAPTAAGVLATGAIPGAPVEPAPSGNGVQLPLAATPIDASASSSAALAPALSALERQLSNGSMLLEGTLTLRVQVFVLSRADATPIEVTDGVQQVVMPLSGGTPVVLARKSLPAGSYAVIRTVFLHVEALVESGLVVDGVAIRGPVRVDLGSRLVVDTPLALTIEEDIPARISVNLHTTRWIRLLTVDRRVRAEDFEGEVRVGRQP